MKLSEDVRLTKGRKALEDKEKKAVAATVAAMLSAGGVAVDATFDDPADILQNSKVEPKVEYATIDLDQPDDEIVPDEDEEKQRSRTAAGILRDGILRLPMAVRVLFVLPLWALGNLILAGGGMLMTALAPFWHWILGFVLLFAVIAICFTLAAKAMFPDLPLRKILNRRTFKGILGVSVAAFAADLVLGLTWSEYDHYKTVVMAGLTLVALGSLVLWFSRRENKARRAEAEKLAAAAAAEAAREPEELVYTSLGETFKIRNPKHSE